MQVKDNAFAVALLIGVWCVAMVGIALRLVLPGRFDRLSVVLYLVDGVERRHDLRGRRAVAVRDGTVVCGRGRALYSLGVIFHNWRRLLFQNFGQVGNSATEKILATSRCSK